MTTGTIATSYAGSDTTAAAVPLPRVGARIANGIHRALNGLILIGVPLQFYAAGLAVFGASSFAMHSVIGQAMVPVSLLSLVAALLGRPAGTRPLLATALFALVALQPVLAFAPRASFPAISAIHPVVGLAIGVIAWRIISSRGRGGV